MFGPRFSHTSSLQRTSTRTVTCRAIDPLEAELLDLLAEESLFDTVDVMDNTAEERLKMVKFLEDQVRAWSQHPSASTWSNPTLHLDD